MTDNPYEPPPGHKATRHYLPLRLTRATLMYFPLAWAVILFVAFMAYGTTGNINPDVPTALKVVSTVVTVAALVCLTLSVRGWKWFLTVPLWIYLVWIQYLVWTFYAAR